MQLVFTDLPDKAALKLTIAQYLTEPGDVSIQGVGVTPDIELDPMTVDSLEMDLTADTNGIKERDLSRALSNVAREGRRPSDASSSSTTCPIKDRLDQRERGGDLDENFELDFPIKFARDFVAHVQPGKRPDEVRQAQAVHRRHAPRRGREGRRGAQDDRASTGATLRPTCRPRATPAAAAGRRREGGDRSAEQRGDRGRADEPQAHRHQQRHGDALSPVRRSTKSENPMFDNKELVIGKLEPGKSRTVTAPAGWCEFKGHKVGSTAELPKDAPRQCARSPRTRSCAPTA